MRYSKHQLLRAEADDDTFGVSVTNGVRLTKNALKRASERGASLSELLHPQANCRVKTRKDDKGHQIVTTVLPKANAWRTKTFDGRKVHSTMEEYTLLKKKSKTKRKKTMNKDKIDVESKDVAAAAKIEPWVSDIRRFAKFYVSIQVQPDRVGLWIGKAGVNINTIQDMATRKQAHADFESSSKTLLIGAKFESDVKKVLTSLMEDVLNFKLKAEELKQLSEPNIVENQALEPPPATVRPKTYDMRSLSPKPSKNRKPKFLKKRQQNKATKKSGGGGGAGSSNWPMTEISLDDCIMVKNRVGVSQKQAKILAMKEKTPEPLKEAVQPKKVKRKKVKAKKAKGSKNTKSM